MGTIEKLSKELNSGDRQYAAIAILTALAEVDAIDLGMRSATGSFQIFAGCGICDPALDDALAACRNRNSRDCDVYFRPARGQPASIVMIDDLDRTTALRLADGHPHMLVETSPANFQVWLKTDRPLDEIGRKSVQIALVARHGGDPGSVSGEHFGRIPGFKNRKPKYKFPWVNLVQYDSESPALDVSDLLSPQGACALEPAAGVPSIHPTGDAPPARSPTPASASASDSPESHREFKYACESLRHNVNRDAIISNIAARALSRGKRRTATAAEQYAARTVAAAERAVL